MISDWLNRVLDAGLVVFRVVAMVMVIIIGLGIIVATTRALFTPGEGDLSPEQATVVVAAVAAILGLDALKRRRDDE